MAAPGLCSVVLELSQNGAGMAADEHFGGGPGHSVAQAAAVHRTY